jgi:hypothetical protein
MVSPYRLMKMPFMAKKYYNKKGKNRKHLFVRAPLKTLPEYVRLQTPVRPRQEHRFEVSVIAVRPWFLQCQRALSENGAYLKHAQVPFVMPVIARGKKETKNNPAGGTRKYRHWKTSGFDRYEMTTKVKGKTMKT